MSNKVEEKVEAPASKVEEKVEAPASVSYIMRPDSSGISVSGRIARKDTHQMLVPLPLDIKNRLESLIEGGSVSGAMVGLIVYALDQIEKNEQRMIVTMPAK